MPILTVLVNQQYTPEQKTALLKSTSQAVVDSLGAPISSVRVSLQTIDAHDVIVEGEIGKEMVLVTAMILPGRTEEKKLALMAALSKAINDTIGVSDQNSRIVLHDIPTTDMSVAGGISAKMAGR